MNNYPTNATEALNALNGFASASTSNLYPEQAFPGPPPNSAGYPSAPMRQPSQHMHPAPQNWNHYPPPAHVQPPQYNQAWPNHLPPQGFHNGLASLPSFFPQQVLVDALALSHPVGPNDEPMLLNALVESRSKGETYKEALNRLHGTAGHSASLWKDYYLDHRDRLDSAIRAYGVPPGPHVKTAKKPLAATFKAESSPLSSGALSSPAPSSRSRRPSQQTASSREPSGGRRRTINSLTAHIPVYNEHLPPPNTELRIPDPPSRSPSPPTQVIPHNRGGNKFTPDDRAYFIKFISWRMKGDPTLLRHELCELLAEKAPHHTAQSWASYWSNHHDLPDKIVASMRDGNPGISEDEAPKPKKKTPVARKPNYRDPSSDSELTGTSEDDEEDEPEDEDDSVDIVIPPADESQMGPRGGPFTKSDLGVVAKHVASFSNFRETSLQDKWADFTRRFPQRTSKSWSEYYRRNQKTIDKLAKKIRKINAAEAEARQTVPAPPPLPRPTWAAPENHGPPRAKRKFGVEEDMEDAAKRIRSE
ncbi:hypothetical protein B0H15DRAFT_863710 [Mycena belliarum]|uniref:Uncharacterized protein n=1 Tax=Mycena belliarum TaxID=1033014 RepID=A0AAD6XIA4_9AGAR|nr:hypothetical protein B0H15DRAFT_863710 [Mycena belliae]